MPITEAIFVAIKKIKKEMLKKTPHVWFHNKNNNKNKIKNHI